MNDRSERAILVGVLARVRRRLLFQTTTLWLVRLAVFVLPAAALLIASDQHWNRGRASTIVAIAALGVLSVASILMGIFGRAERFQAAVTLDQHARLKDRISSAWEFLQLPKLGEAHKAQIQDAIRHAEALNCSTVLRTRWPRSTAALPVLALIFALSFFVPPLSNQARAHIGKDPRKIAQLQLLTELKQELEAKKNPPPEIQEILKKLEEVRHEFEKGELGERGVMLELGRLDEALRSKLDKMGVEKLEAEVASMVPNLEANAATAEIAEDMKEQKYDKAGEALKQLGEKVSLDKIPKDQQKNLANALSKAAAQLGNKPSADSFSGDLKEAAESLEKSDCQGFCSSCTNMSNKLSMVSKSQGMKSASMSLAMCKGGLGQCDSKELGYKEGPQTQGDKKGGLKAGTAASGNPFGDGNRLGGSYEKMLQVAGEMGKGPMESSTEMTAGQLSSSKLDVREVYASYAAAAEQVIEKEDIPLSQRYHVKRYFQAIRPQD